MPETTTGGRDLEIEVLPAENWVGGSLCEKCGELNSHTYRVQINNHYYHYCRAICCNFSQQKARKLALEEHKKYNRY